MQDTHFVSLGGVWLDEIRRPDHPPAKDIVGGSATYALLGARLFSAGHASRLVLIVNAGKDFPPQVIDELRHWNTRLTVITNKSEFSTRGVLEILGTAGSRFTRLTPPLLTSPSDLLDAGAINSKVFHVFAAPDLARTQCNQIEELRRQHLGAAACSPSRPIIIWEPHPKSCVPKQLEDHLALLHNDDGPIAVFSPNHHETNAFFGGSATTSFDRKTLEIRARALLGPPRAQSSDQGRPSPRVNVTQVIVIRAAENGCLIMPRDSTAPALWLPAYYGSDQQESIVDPTGAGNAFLGGLAQGWLESGNWAHAACYGMVAASVIVQHVGPPKREGSHLNETWGRADVRARFEEYMARPAVQAALTGSKVTSVDQLV